MNVAARCMALASAALIGLTGCARQQPATVANEAPPQQESPAPAPTLLDESFYETATASAEAEATMLTSFMRNRKNMQNREFGEAVQGLRSALTENPEAYPLYPYLFESYEILLRFMVREPRNRIWGDALTWYRKAARDLPEQYHPPVLEVGSRTVGLYMEARRNRDALELFEILRQLGGAELPIRLARGELLIIEKDLVRATREFERAYELEMERLQAEEAPEVKEETLDLMAALNTLYLEAGQLEAFLEKLSDMRKAAPDSPELSLLEARLAAATGDHERAVKLYEAMLDNRELAEEILLELAVSYNETGQPEKMVDLLEEAVTDYSLAEEASTLLMGHYFDEEQYDAALAVMEETAQLFPSMEEGLVLRYGWMSLRSEQFERGIPLLEERVLNLSDKPVAFQLLFDLYRGNEQLESALEIALRTRARFPEDPSGCEMEATARLQQKEYDHVANHMFECFEDFPDNTRLQFSHGVAHYHLGNEAAYEEIFTRIIANDPLNHSALNFLGYSLAERGDRLEEAERYIRRALRLEPESAAYLDSMGWVLYQKGEYEDAMRFLSQAAEIRPDDAVILDHLGDCHYRLGNVGRAVSVWREALELVEDDPKLRRMIEYKLEYRTIPDMPLHEETETR